MKIIEFASTRLHGYLNMRLDFNADLTFLTGINGSGKTSAVRAMTALLGPSLAALSDMKFDSISVTVTSDEQNTVISATRSNDQLLLTCTTDVSLEPFAVPIYKVEGYETPQRYHERRTEYYREQEAISSDHPVMATIRSLPTPMFLDLERSYHENPRYKRPGLRSATGRILPSSNPFGGSLADSLSSAQGLVEDAYEAFIISRSQMTDKLKQELILSAFRQTKGQHEFKFWNQRPDFLNNLQQTQGVVISSLTQIGISSDDILKIVVPFFEHVRTTASNLPDEKDLIAGHMSQEEIATFSEWSALQPQVQQINRIAGRIAQYNDGIESDYAALGRYLKSVNSFLSDGNKRLSFTARGRIRIYVAGDDAEPREITALSSGERQIVVILTHLAFNRQAKRANILIIDEPELSLHLRWQEAFVEAVLSASPGLQLILATHSPSIIKGRTDKCIDVAEEGQHAGLFA